MGHTAYALECGLRSGSMVAPTLVLARGIMLKGNTLVDLWPQVWPILAFMLVVIGIGLALYRRTLD